jgi:ClpP class serine protease
MALPFRITISRPAAPAQGRARAVGIIVTVFRKLIRAYNGVRLPVAGSRRKIFREANNLNLSDFIWVFVLAAAVWPMLRQSGVNRRRLEMLRRIEKKRSSRVISLIHRQEAISLLGIPIGRYIDVEDSEQLLRAIRLTPDDTPIDLILHTPGGLVLAAEQIARAVRAHPAGVTVLVPHYAMSGGTLIALAAGAVVMDENAVLGPVDPQLGQYPAVSILSAVRQKPIDRVDDDTLILADIAYKAIRQVEDAVAELLAGRLPPEDAQALAKTLTDGRWTHDYPFTCAKLRELGLSVDTNMPREIYELMELYPQPRQMSVQYLKGDR